MSSGSDRSSGPKLAFLGPLGTYSHQAAHERFGDAVEYFPQRTIRDVYEALSDNVPFALLPFENSTFGPVLETLDLLARAPAGTARFVRGETTLRVRHCLLVRRGTLLGSIRRVLSHEQALGQCSRWLAEHLPGVALVKTASTAGAAEALGAGEAGDAAICSAVCTSVYEGLEILQEGIQNADDNLTRFIVVSRSLKDAVPGPDPAGDSDQALIRIAVGGSTIVDVLSALRLPVTQVDRRPAGTGPTFVGVYFVRAGRQHDTNAQYNQGAVRWQVEVEAALGRVRDAGGEGAVLGIW